MRTRTYCFTTRDGGTVEREFPPGEAPAYVWVDGARACRDYRAEGARGVVKNETASRRSRGKAKWPMEPCVGSGVGASQATELRKHLLDRGCPTEVTPGGDPIYRSSSHRKKALKLRGLHDRNSFD